MRMPHSAGRSEFHMSYLEKREWMNGGRSFVDGIARDLEARSSSATIMEASVFVECYRGRFTPGNPVTEPATVDFEYTMSKTYHEVMSEWKALHPEHYAEMATYRSRLPFHYAPLQVRELESQAAKFEKGISMVQSLLPGIKTEQEEIRGKYFDLLAKYEKTLSVGPHFDKFVAEHKTSSFSPGLKWPVILQMPDVRDEMLQSQRDNVGYVLDNQDDFRYDSDRCLTVNPYCLHVAGRGRNESFETLRDITEGRISRKHERDRNVFYNAGWNLNAYLPDAIGFYKEWFDYSLDVLGLADVVGCPVVEGAAVFEDIANEVENGYYLNFDAKGWDGIVTQFTNITSTSTPLLPSSCLLWSGGFDTSSEGSVGHALLLRALLDAKPAMEKAFVTGKILGDDLGAVFSEDISPGLVEIPNVYECDTAGSRVTNFLGMCMTHPERFHPAGIKISQESPEKAIRIYPYEWSDAITPKHDDEVRQIVKNIYCGYGADGETPLREVFRLASFEGLDYLSPTKIFDRIVDMQKQLSDDEDSVEDI